MSANILHVLTDDAGDLQRQIGCMTGIFQLFDRHHLITGRRIDGRRRLPSGEKPQQDRKPEILNGVFESFFLFFILFIFIFFSRLQQASSTETTFELSKYAERPLQNMSKIHDFDANVRSIASPRRDPPIPHGRQSLDFRDVVKDSIYRDAHGLSVKTVKKEEPVNNVMKHRDSPRPFHLSKSVDKAYILGADGKQRVPVDLNESLKVLAKLKEAPWYFNDPKETPRPSYEGKDGYSISRDTPRFSFDSKEAAKSTANKLRSSQGCLWIAEKLNQLHGSSRKAAVAFRKRNSDLRKQMQGSIRNLHETRKSIGANVIPSSSVVPISGLQGLRKLRTGDSNENKKASTDSNASLASQVDLEVTSADRSTPGTRSPSSKAAHSAASALKQKFDLASVKSSSPLNDDISPMELALATPEQPSPISVLDSSFYRDDLISSPVKKPTGAYRDNIQNPGEIFLKERRNSVSLGAINNKKLENIEILVQKLQQLSTDPEDPPATDHIASLCDNENPDHRYISEILLSSGLLLRDLTTAPVQLHPSGHPINPDLFLVLEQTKSGRLLKAEPVSNKAPRTKTDQEKVHRKLIFDAVNENLIQKLALAGPNSEPWVQAVAVKLALRPPSGHRLLKELCSTIDQFQLSSWVVDLMMKWTV
ncbi:Protein LONGIFOLIA 1 [Acorus calamus]|uniref:Protein LONGIFOLIA 1 n=1 Tax=Acorus calamus TaxID=4465 RepID=A0AAV9DZF6_ACOCL|nr:Protein LONGIFOLIA 1 [Acorus calamus]